MPPTLRHSVAALLLALTLAGGACGGRKSLPVATGAGGGGAGHVGGDGSAGATGAAGTATDPDAGLAQDAAAGTGAVSDPGRVLMHRLTNVEYDNTARDLLGVTTTPAATFQPDEVDEATGGFDNLAENLHLSPARYQQYYAAAGKLADAVWLDPALRARIMICTPDLPSCAGDVIGAFGLRAWRRPLEASEHATLTAFAQAALAETGDFSLAMKRVVTAMLSSLPFLYKIERVPAAGAADAEPLSGYEVSSRLSYLLWSSMPDDELLSQGERLRGVDVVRTQLDRMLADPRAAALTRNFAGQWLGLRELETHVAAKGIFPTWDDELRQSMVKEMSLYFGEFLDRSFDDLLSADLNFIDRRLAAHYQVRANPTDFERVSLLPLRHLGFLGLAGFQTLTSPSYRTSPSARGAWIAQHLLCDTSVRSPHAGDPPPLDLAGIPVDPRKALQATLTQAQCAACHATFDGMGFALEAYDGIGLLRDYYKPTVPLDTKGSLPDGRTFDDASGLAATLARDPRLVTCATRKTLSYALGRVLDDGDRARVDALVEDWRGGTLRDLLRTIVLSDAFRSRKGGP
jgi:hypothetical protein